MSRLVILWTQSLPQDSLIATFPLHCPVPSYEERAKSFKPEHIKVQFFHNL